MRILTFLLFAASLCAEDRPQFVWQGEVDGTAILYLHANHLDVKVKDGAPIVNQKFHFYQRLPEARQDTRVDVRKGRGYVQIVDQPRLENHYTLAVSVEDRQPGSSFYSIAMYWDASNRVFERGSGRSDKVAWNGRVDEEALISCQETTCSSSTSRGAPVAAERFKFSRPLPPRDVDVTLESPEGRGDIRLVEQPSQRNHYTARVSIRDPQAGSGEYSFTLAWTRPSTKEVVPVIEAQRGMLWTGVVNGRARVTIRGGTAYSEVIQGPPISGEHTDFVRRLPSSSDLNPAVKKISGRGRVEIVENPSEQNNYRLVFEISDSESGPSRYEIEVDW